MRQCNGMGVWVIWGKVRLSTGCAGAGAGAGVKQQPDGEDTGTSILFIFHGPPVLQTPFSPPGLLSSDPYPAFTCPLGPILLPSFAQTSASPKLPAALGPFSASKIASDAHPIASAPELQSHRWMLALGLTEGALRVFCAVPRHQKCVAVFWPNDDFFRRSFLLSSHFLVFIFRHRAM